MVGNYYSSTWDNWATSGTSTATSTWRGCSNSDYYYTLTTSSNTVWVQRNDATGSTISDNQTWTNWQYNYVTQPVRERTTEERQRDEEERIRLAELAKEKAEQAKIAEEKALQLLLENLTENQAEIFKMTGAIPVVCPSGRKYKIKKGTSRNIIELGEKDETKAFLCFHPCDYAIPVHDVMLAQKLMLEVCEEDARRIANFS